MRYVPDFVGQASKLAKMNPKRFGASHIRTVEEQSLPIITGCQDFFALGRNFNLSPLFRRRHKRLFQKRPGGGSARPIFIGTKQSHINQQFNIFMGGGATLSAEKKRF